MPTVWCAWPLQHMLSMFSRASHAVAKLLHSGHRNYKGTTNVRHSYAFTNDFFRFECQQNVCYCFCRRLCYRVSSSSVPYLTNEHIFVWPKYQFRSNSCVRWFAGIHTDSVTANWHTCHIINFRPTVFISLHHTTNTDTHGNIWAFILLAQTVASPKKKTQERFLKSLSRVLLCILLSKLDLLDEWW